MTVRSDKRLYFKPSIAAEIRCGDRIDNVTLTNISRTGLGFQTEELYHKGDKLLIKLKRDEKNLLPRRIKAKVINEYGVTENGLNEYGVRFFRISYWYEKNCIHNYVYKEQTEEQASSYLNRKQDDSTS